MTASQIYAQETGRESHSKAGTPYPAYVDWMERIVAETAGMIGIVESDRSVWNNDHVEELCGLFQRTA